MTKKKKIKKNSKLNQLPIIAILLLGGYLLYRSIIVNTIVPLQIAEIKDSTGTVNLSLQTTKTELLPNEITTVKVSYDSPTSKVATISGQIAYDPTLITPSDFVPSADFPTVLIPASTNDGKIIFSYSTPIATESGLIGQGTVLTFKIKANQVGSADLYFTDQTTVLVEQIDGNALREITNTTITISSVSPSPSPSPSASAPVGIKPVTPSNLRYNCYSNGTRITLRWDTVSGASDYEVSFDQKDGDQDQTKTSSRAELDLDIKGNTNYTWKVAAKKDGLIGDYSTVNDVKCSTGNINNSPATPTPSPSPSKSPASTPKNSPSPNTQSVTNSRKQSASSKPSVSPLTNPPASSGGSLSDIFGSPIPSDTPSSNNAHSLWEKIALGWQALFYRLVESLTR